MRLDQLLTSVRALKVTGAVDVRIESIAYDSRRVKAGSLFVALRGENVDGHQYIPQAIDAGAVAVVCEEAVQNARSTIVVV